MSVSGSREMQTAILRPPTTSGGSTNSISLDATEDRQIHGVEVSPDIDANSDFQATYDIYLGNDPFPGADSVNDSEQLALRSKFSNDTTAGNDYDCGDSLEVDTPFPWDEHVTLTVDLQENTASSHSGTVTVYYTEA